MAVQIGGVRSVLTSRITFPIGRNYDEPPHPTEPWAENYSAVGRHA